MLSVALTSVVLAASAATVAPQAALPADRGGGRPQAAQQQHHPLSGVAFLGGDADHHTAAAHRHRNRHAWRRRAVATSASEIAEAKEFEKRVFEQGRKLRERKAEYLRRLSVQCKQGDTECRRAVREEQINEERRLALGGHEDPAAGSHRDVTDAMGRSMPLLFNKPHHSQPQKDEESDRSAAGVVGAPRGLLLPLVGLVLLAGLAA